ncbi:MAG: hypothetical protein QF805_27660, partial [Pirellulaceae bacterium]|nr:hypothetical protein [Pirellulaceae bacterium]
HREVQGRALLELVSYFQQRGRFFPRRSRADNGPAIKEVLKIMISDYPDIKTPRGVTLKQYAEERLAVD